MKPKRKKDQPAEQYMEFMARAYAMELEATERYAQFAEQLETHNNREVAELFRKLAGIEALHAKRIRDDMRWPAVPVLTPAFAWESPEGPETAPFEMLHYLMQPWHALEIALRCEIEAEAYYAGIARSRAPGAVREAAREMAAEEAEHVRLIRDWMKRVPRPPKDWDEDPDPPRMNE